MSESKELTVAEQPQQLITIEPKKYVELVFEPFAKRLENAKTLAEAAEFDVTTTAGMAVAVKHRATFRDIRVASEKARKERKAPILEIGKLLDSRQKEIEAEIEPFESRFDAAIKAEEKRKDDEKIAKALAESARISAIRKRIAETQAIPSMLVGKSSETIAAAIESLEAVQITLETHAEFAGEAEVEKAGAVLKLSSMLEKQKDHEADQARLASEREALERQRAELAEQERKDREAREDEDALVDSIWKNARRIESNTAPYIRKAIGTFESMAKDWENDSRQRVSGAIASARDEMQTKLRSAEEAAERETREAELRRQREAEEAKLAEQRAEIARQQAEITAERQRQADDAARVEREKQAAIAAEAARVAAEEQRKREEAEAAARAEAERIADEQAAEANRVHAEKAAAYAERLRRERDGFIASGPGNVEIIEVVANHWGVESAVALRWIKTRDWHPVEIAA